MNEPIVRMPARMTFAALLFGLAAIVFYWLKVDAHGVLLSLFFLLVSTMLAIGMLRQEKSRGSIFWIRIMILLALTVLSVGNVFVEDKMWTPMLMILFFYYIVHESGRPFLKPKRQEK